MYKTTIGMRLIIKCEPPRSLDVPPDFQAKTLKSMIASELSVSEDVILILFRGHHIDGSSSLVELGLVDDSEIELVRLDLLSQQLAGGVGVPVPQLSDGLMRSIETALNRSAVDSNLQTAIEHHPENFSSVNMLYIEVFLGDGFAVKAFVDTGAEKSILSEDCARRAGLEYLIDHRFQGIAVGVGSRRIIGKIHVVPIAVANSAGEMKYFPCTFIVLESGGHLDFILGLDMLKRHQCKVDLCEMKLLYVPFD